jgi:hypothetical protein
MTTLDLILLTVSILSRNYTSQQNQRCYYKYIAELYMINYLNFIWEPYNVERLAEHRPEGLLIGRT